MVKMDGHRTPVRDQGWDEWIALFANRDEVAHEYADLLVSYRETDWPALNAAILRRWSPAGLAYIKQRAWRLAGG
jgi:hypothetical protein